MTISEATVPSLSPANPDPNSAAAAAAAEPAAGAASAEPPAPAPAPAEPSAPASAEPEAAVPSEPEASGPVAPEASAPSEPEAPALPAVSPFLAYGLDPRLIRAVERLGFTTPTPIQDRAITALMEGQDVIGRARTGSGKTAAFGLPLLDRVKSGRSKTGGVRALVLTPTRELALQVTQAIMSYATDLPVQIVTVYGGASYGPQLDALRAGVPVVVGTPGRLIDHLERGALDLSGVELVVIDEADEMLRMGFIDDVEKILTATPPERQVALFSATLPDPIRAIAARHLRNPHEIQVEERALTVHHIGQRWLRVPASHKREALERILLGEPRGTTLVFARTRAACAETADALQSRGFAVDALHGDLDQSARERVMARLRRGDLDLVIATDVAARGLDVDHITHVINFDLPHDTETYVHRIGRTGRAGREGQAISFITPQQMQRVRELERSLRVQLVEMQVPSDAAIAARKRGALREELARALEAHGFDAVQQTVTELLTATSWTVEDLAAAALRLLADGRNLDLGHNADPNPPFWARPPVRSPWGDRGGDARGPRNDARGPRPDFRGDDRGPRPDFRGDDRGPRPDFRGDDRGPREDFRGDDRGPRGDERGDADRIGIILPIGRMRGLRPGDIVGAVANELGIAGSRIGRIGIGDRDSMVELLPEDAARVLDANEPLVIRGVPVWPRRREAPAGRGPDRTERHPRESGEARFQRPHRDESGEPRFQRPHRDDRQGGPPSFQGPPPRDDRQGGPPTQQRQERPPFQGAPAGPPNTQRQERPAFSGPPAAQRQERPQAPPAPAPVAADDASAAPGKSKFVRKPGWAAPKRRVFENTGEKPPRRKG